MALHESVQPSAPEIKTRESLSTQQTSSLLSAVGNHEAKALLVASMTPGIGYSSADLDRIFELRQGKYSVWKMKVVPFYSYCRGSFAPAGVVEVALRDENLEPSRYAVTPYGAELAVAMAGHLLGYSEENPEISLIRAFGHSPFTRFRIFQELISGTLPTREADLVKKLDKTPHLVGGHLRALRRNGIISYESSRIDEAYARFKLNSDRPDEPPLAWMKNVTFTNEIYRIVIENPVMELNADTILPLLVYRNPSLMRNEDDKRKRIAAVLSHLERHGYIKRLKFGFYQQSEANLTEEQRSRLEPLVAIVERFLTRDPQFLAEGISKAHQIVNDQRRFSALLQKARETSPNANEASSAETMKQIITILYSNPRATNREIQEHLRTEFDRDISTSAVARLTKILSSGGFISISDKGTGFHFEIPVHESESGIIYSYSSKESKLRRRIPRKRKTKTH